MVVARRDFDPQTFDPKAKLIDLVNDLTLLAMVGIVDPPRAEAKDAIAKCHSAGIQVRMITGDHAVTAAAIGHELGIEGTALTGAQFAAMSDDELMKQLPEIGVVARVAPEDKIRLVDLLQQQQNIVAMTGDGVNDAPALKKADIGVAMGITGTEVSKGAAVMILTDDNFATIVKAVEYGRAIYDNLSNYIRFQMTALVAFIAALPGRGVLRHRRRRAVYAVRGPVDQLPGAGAHRHRPGLRQACARADGAQAAPAEPTRALALAMGAHHLHRAPHGGRHVVPGGRLCAGRRRGGRHDGVRRLLALQHRHRPQLPQRNRQRVQPGYPERSAPVDALRAGPAVHLPADRVGLPQRFLGLTSLSGNQWLLCIVFAFALLLVDEVIKIFLRRRRAAPEAAPTVGAVAASG